MFLPPFSLLLLKLLLICYVFYISPPISLCYSSYYFLTSFFLSKILKFFLLYSNLILILILCIFLFKICYAIGRHIIGYFLDSVNDSFGCLSLHPSIGFLFLADPISSKLLYSPLFFLITLALMLSSPYLVILSCMFMYENRALNS